MVRKVAYRRWLVIMLLSGGERGRRRLAVRRWVLVVDKNGESAWRGRRKAGVVGKEGGR